MFHKIWIKDGFLLKPHPIGLPWREAKEIDVDNEFNRITRTNTNNSNNKPCFLSLAQKNCFEYGYLNNAFKNYQDSRKTSNNSIVSTDFGKKKDDIFMRSKDNSNNSLLLKNVCKKSGDDCRSNYHIRYPHSKEHFSRSNNTLFDNKKNLHSYSAVPTSVVSDTSSFGDAYNYGRFTSTGRLNSTSSIATNQINQSPLSSNNVLHEQMMSSNTNSPKTSLNIFSPVRKNSPKNISSNLNSSIMANSCNGISNENIIQIFLENNLDKYIEKVEEQELDMEIFLTLNRQDLINVFEIKTKSEDNSHLTTMLNLIKYYKNLYNMA